MNVRQQVLKTIKQSIKFTPDELRATLNLSEMLLPQVGELPSLEIFMNPPPDVVVNENNCSTSFAQAYNILGYYRPIQSPGIIVLLERNLLQFFWRIAIEIDQNLSGWRWKQEDLINLSEWIVDKTYWHERCHHSLDVLRHLFHVHTFDEITEEALAVAYARYHLCEVQKLSYRHRTSPQQALWEAFLHLAFQYRSPGYRDWPQYSDQEALKRGLSEYLAPRRIHQLKGIGIPVASMIFDLMPIVNGYEEWVR